MDRQSILLKAKQRRGRKAWEESTNRTGHGRESRPGNGSREKTAENRKPLSGTPSEATIDYRSPVKWESQVHGIDELRTRGVIIAPDPVPLSAGN